MAELDAYHAELKHHLSLHWGRVTASDQWDRGPGLPNPFCVLLFEQKEKTRCWTYATCGMTPVIRGERLELFVESPAADRSLVELLTVVAHYHQTGATLGHGHTVNFGRPWLANSRCTYGLISLPYCFGPAFERTSICGVPVRILWLIPITLEEREFKIAAGLEALEEKFETSGFNWLDPARPSVV